MIARRLPGHVRIRWLVIVDRGLDPAYPRIRAGLESVLTALRAETGVEGGAGLNPGGPGRGEIPAVVQSRRGAGRRMWM